MKNILKEKIVKFGLPLIAVAAVVLAGYFYSQVRTLKQNPQSISQKEVNDLVSKVGKLAFLPEGEVPTIATVSDPEALKDQPFFNKSQKGDKVLIYAQSKKAILYSVSTNKIIDVAPLNIGSQKPVTPPAATTTDTVTPAPTAAKKK
jgi:hypothetical protein